MEPAIVYIISMKTKGQKLTVMQQVDTNNSIMEARTISN